MNIADFIIEAKENDTVEMPLSVRAEELRQRFNLLCVEHVFAKGDLVKVKNGIGGITPWGCYGIVTETDTQIIAQKLGSRSPLTEGSPIIRHDMLVGVIDPDGRFCEYGVDRAHFEPWTPPALGEDA